MCDHHGQLTQERLAATRLSAPNVSRRGFIRTSGAMTLTLGVSGLAGKAVAAGETLTSTHGTGFCNLNLFLSHAEQFAREDGLTLEFINTPTFADQVTFLGTGQVDIGLTPYTSFMALYDAGVPLTIIAAAASRAARWSRSPGSTRRRS